MSEERILDALAEAAEAAAAVFRQHAAQTRPLWPAERPAGRLLDRARQINPMLGPRQAEVLSELEAAGPAGTTAGAIAWAMNYDPPHADITLGARANQGLVGEDTSVYPQVYRLSPALRGGAADARQPRD
jgi:hypothetical protein